MRRAIAGLGRTLITVGLLILAFVVYQLWGTGYFTQREQNALDRQLRTLAEQAPDPTPATTSPSTRPSGPSTTSTSTPEDLPAIAEGDPLGWIRIPKLGADYVFVQGTEREDLKKGPGHYPSTVLPGQIGNAAIAGHRTTYLAPFNRLDELVPGDEITVEMPYIGVFRYRVATMTGPNPFVVTPDQVEVAAQRDALRRREAWLTLTTCNPKYSARERLVVRAVLDPTSAAPLAHDAKLPVKLESPKARVNGVSPAEEEQILRESLSGDPASRTTALWWAGLTVLVGGLWWLVYRHFRHPLTWFVGFVPFLVPLVGFYIFLERSLPAGY